MKCGFDWPKGFREEEKHGHIHKYSSGAGTHNPLGSEFYINITLLSIWSFAVMFFLLNDFVTVFPI